MLVQAGERGRIRTEPDAVERRRGQGTQGGRPVAGRVRVVEPRSRQWVVRRPVGPAQARPASLDGAATQSLSAGQMLRLARQRVVPLPLEAGHEADGPAERLDVRRLTGLVPKLDRHRVDRQLEQAPALHLGHRTPRSAR